MILVTGSEHAELTKSREREISKGLLTPHDLRSGLATGAALATGATVVAGGTAAALARHQRAKQRKAVSKAGTTANVAPKASAAPTQLASAPPKLKAVPPAGAVSNSAVPPAVVAPGASTIRKDDRPAHEQRRAAAVGGLFGTAAGATALDYKHSRAGFAGGKHVRYPNGTRGRNAAIIGGAAAVGAAVSQHQRIGAKTRQVRRTHAARVLGTNQ